MSTNTSTSVAGSERRLYTVTAMDHTAYIVIGTAFGIAVLPVFWVFRYLVRRTADFGADDILLTCSSVIAIAQSGILLSACSYGLGQSTPQAQLGRVATAQQLYYASIILWLLSLATSKASTASLLLRLGATKQHRIAFQAMLAYVVLWAVASTFAVAMQCDLSQPWKLIGAECSNTVLRWRIISAFDILFEVALSAASVVFVWPLNTSINTKVNVVFAFSFRLLLVVTVSLRLANLSTETVTHDPLLQLDLFIVWSQAQMYWSIISAMIPGLRPFLRGLSTYTESLAGSSTTQRHAHSAGYELSNIDHASSNAENRKRRSHTWKNGLDTISSGIKNKGQSSHGIERAQPKAGVHDTGSLSSNNSQNMIIQKDVQFSVAWGSN